MEKSVYHIEDQVLSIEKMKELESLGMDTSDASMFWYKNNESPEFIGEYLLMPNNGVNRPVVSFGDIPTYTLVDILKKLRFIIKVDGDKWFYFLNICEGVNDGHNNLWCIEYKNNRDEILVEIENDSVLEAAYQMLVWCIGNGYIKTDKV